MNIGIFSDTYSPQVNGVVSSILTLEKELRGQGHQVYIFTVSHPEAHEDNEFVYRMASVPFIFLKDQRVGIVYSNKAVHKIKELELDLILSQTEFSMGIFARMMAKKLDIPIIHTYHTVYEDYMHYISKGIDISPALARKYSKSFCNHVDAIVAPTKKTEKLLKSYGVKKPIRIIPTGIDFKPFSPQNYSEEEVTELKEMFHVPPNDPIILFIGRLAKEKSIDVLIKAMPKLLEKIPNAKLVIVGGGPSQLELEKLAESLHIKESIIFTGMQPWNTIGRMYQLGDVFASASTSETQGLTFAEAMAAALPVVAMEDESIAGFVKDNYNGRLFHNEEELAAVLFDILSHTSYRYLLSENALNSIIPLSSETFGTNVMAYYQEIMEDYKKSSLEESVESKRKSFKLPFKKNKEI